MFVKIMNRKIIILIVLCFIIFVIFGVPYAYKKLDEKYQNAQDPIRLKQINQIADVIFDYDKKIGHPPLSDLVKQYEKSFMVLIGRSEMEEDRFANIEALNKGAMYMDSSKFEEILSQGLKETVNLPRDPQKVATYAPNVYIYYVNEEQFCVVAHLYNDSEISQPYTWEGGTFNSHAQCYSKKN
jgi:uncharacterized protein YneF (UPF0154 family)